MAWLINHCFLVWCVSLPSQRNPLFVTPVYSLVHDTFSNFGKFSHFFHSSTNFLPSIFTNFLYVHTFCAISGLHYAIHKLHSLSMTPRP